MPASDRFAYIKGLRELRRALNPPGQLYDNPWLEAMTDLAESGAAAGVNDAPYRTGKLQSKIFARVQKKPFPMWAAVRSRARTKGKRGKKGFDYPRLLEYSLKHGHRHWFSQSVWPRLIGRAEGVLVTAANKIERNWSK